MQSLLRSHDIVIKVIPIGCLLEFGIKGLTKAHHKIRMARKMKEDYWDGFLKDWNGLVH